MQEFLDGRSARTQQCVPVGKASAQGIEGPPGRILAALRLHDDEYQLINRILLFTQRRIPVEERKHARDLAEEAHAGVHLLAELIEIRRRVRAR